MSESLDNATKVAALLKTEVDKQFEEGTVLKFDRTIRTKPSAADRRTIASARSRGREFADLEEEDEEEYEARMAALTTTQTFKYVTYFVNGRWYFTGAGDLGVKKLKTRELLERIVDGEFTNIEVATGFMPVAD